MQNAHSHRPTPRRRDLFALLGGAIAAWPFAAGAQHAPPVVGYLSAASRETDAFRLPPFRTGLAEAGFVEGHNLSIDYRYAGGDYGRLAQFASDLIAQKVDVILAGGLPAALAAQAATSTIPIIFSIGVDPVAFRLAASLRRPGGNLTGVTFLFDPLGENKLQLLHELVPAAGSIGFLINSQNRNAVSHEEYVAEAAKALGLATITLTANTAAELEQAFAIGHERGVGAVLVGDDPFFDTRREQIVALAARYALPTMHYYREFADSGGLISYGPNVAELRRQAGLYVGRILKGERPGELPVVQPAKFELVINLKTAKALGLTVPQSLLARADEVLE